MLENKTANNVIERYHRILMGDQNQLESGGTDLKYANVTITFTFASDTDEVMALQWTDIIDGAIVSLGKELDADFTAADQSIQVTYYDYPDSDGEVVTNPFTVKIPYQTIPKPEFQILNIEGDIELDDNDNLVIFGDGSFTAHLESSL